jgi:large subunit ribosomal protein L18
MQSNDIKKFRAAKRIARVRGRVIGTLERPRLTVHKSLKNIEAQVIDDERMITLAAVSSLQKDIAGKKKDKMKKTDVAALVGEAIARLALEKGIKKVAFDRNRSIFHGRVKALAEAARKAGLEF